MSLDASRLLEYLQDSSEYVELDKLLMPTVLLACLWVAGWLAKVTAVKGFRLSWWAVRGVGLLAAGLWRFLKPTPPVPSELAVTILEALAERDGNAKTSPNGALKLGNCEIAQYPDSPNFVRIDGQDVTDRLTRRERKAIVAAAEKLRRSIHEEETADLAESLVLSLRPKRETAPPEAEPVVAGTTSPTVTWSISSDGKVDPEPPAEDSLPKPKTPLPSGPGRQISAKRIGGCEWEVEVRDHGVVHTHRISFAGTEAELLRVWNAGSEVPVTMTASTAVPACLSNRRGKPHPDMLRDDC